ncbi:AraC family transcriptional regulator [Cohnella nanjingensis]|uniref:AraC family transcriptional regulator n=1 Tax=Cohnella nanjingensis TaxID=1387779 RepID=A0A7X0RSK3_9BACL|nr:AraC family transcriptional regulator [Cohnella nanjingensis]MBB6672944.1 AraC family transcriptional regulator [Cohnella nanjingensis]
MSGTIFEIVEARVAAQAPSWAGGDSALRRHTLLFASAGCGELTVSGRSAKLAPDHLYLFAPGTDVQLELEEGREAEIYWVAFDLFRMAERSDSIRSFERDLTFPAEGNYRMSGSRFKRFFSLLAQEGEAPTGGSRFLAQQYLYEMLDDLLQRRTESADSDDAQAGLKLSISYMQRHYREDIRVDKLAELARLHPTYYSHLFKRTMKRTPVSFLTHLRMNKAKEMLLQTDKPVRDIARDVGYDDEFYFSRRFKKTNGIAPTVYTKRSDLKIVSLSYPYTDHLYTLGLTPCAAQVHRYIPLETRKLDLPKHASEPWEIGRQAFIDIQPDLILCKDNVLPKAREHVNDIAPIISIPWTSKDVFEHLRVIAELLGRKQEARLWLDNHERRAEQLRRQVRSSIGSATVAICVVKESGLRMYGSRNVGHVFYRSLQLSPPERIAQLMEPHPAGTAFNWTGFAPEELAHFEADYLLLAVSSANQRRSIQRLLMTEPAWKTHPAVLGRRVR